jgi:ABC-type glycerol-3-phosphate transport system substrate-binding protein
MLIKYRVLRTAALALLLIIALATAACSSGSNNDGRKEPKATTNASGDANQAGQEPTSEPEPPITLKLWGMGTNGSVPGPGVQSDPVAKEIEKRFNIKLELYPQETEEVFSTMLASGDFPDIMIVNKKFAKQLIDGKVVMDLEPLVQEHAPNIASQTTMIYYDKQYMSDGTGKLYFLTTKTGAKDTPALVVAPWLRWDYYKEMEYPAITNTDEYLNVLNDMVKKHPVNEDGKKVFGLSPWFDWGMWSYTTPAYYNGIWQFGMLDYDMKNDMAVSYTATNPESSYYWTAQLYNKAHRMGLLDPDSFTQKFDTATQKAEAHRVAGSMVGFQLSGGNDAFFKAGQPNMGYAPVAPPEGTKAYWAGYVQPLGADSHLAVSASTKDPERVVKFLDFLFTEEGSRLLYSGVPGEHYEEDGGKKMMKEDIMQIRKENDQEFRVQTGVQRYGSFAGLAGSDKDANGQYLSLLQEPELLAREYKPLEKEHFDYYGVGSYEELIEKRIDTYLVDTAVILLSGQTPDDVKRVDDKITTYLTTNGPKLILAKTDEEFNKLRDKMIEEIKGMDADLSINYWTKVAQDAKDVMAKVQQ